MQLGNSPRDDAPFFGKHLEALDKVPVYLKDVENTIEMTVFILGDISARFRYLAQQPLDFQEEHTLPGPMDLPTDHDLAILHEGMSRLDLLSKVAKIKANQEGNEVFSVGKPKTSMLDYLVIKNGGKILVGVEEDFE